MLKFNCIIFDVGERVSRIWREWPKTEWLGRRKSSTKPIWGFITVNDWIIILFPHKKKHESFFASDFLTLLDCQYVFHNKTQKHIYLVYSERLYILVSKCFYVSTYSPFNLPNVSLISKFHSGSFIQADLQNIHLSPLSHFH